MTTFAKEVMTSLSFFFERMTSLSLLVWHCEVLNFWHFHKCTHTLEEANSKKAELIKSGREE